MISPNVSRSADTLTPAPIGIGREPGWSLVAFSERPLPVGQHVNLIVAAQEASDSFEITIEIFCWSENAQELAEAMVTGLLIWPMNAPLNKEKP
ncbi:TPA: hypothetical protein L4W63_000324 [Pseudomonas aeruginosa]|uniref:hypothetical protein n=1 Tax=Stutzerimonas nitrititolerans TaxID=2482751 RepID=UPI0028A1B556|nr:hypothetical protein [Stutzerimonas nitrititolerans]HBO5116067.1 hypothetical protein [Pseudomonas aeruginosa]